MLIQNLNSGKSITINYKGDMNDFYNGSKGLFNIEDEPVVSERRLQVTCSNEQEYKIFSKQVSELYVDYLSILEPNKFPNFQLIAGVGQIRII